MLLSLCISGIFLSVVLLYFTGRNFASGMYLGVFFLIMSQYGMTQYAVLYSKSVFLVSVFFINPAFIWYLIGPMLFFYTRSVLTDKSQLSLWDLLHFVPMFVYLIAEIPWLFTSFAYKTEVAKAIVNNAAYLFEFKATILSDWFGVNALYMSRPVLQSIYTLWCIFIFIRYLYIGRNSTGFANQRFMIKWLSVFLGFHFLFVISNLALIFKTFVLQIPELYFTVNVLQIFFMAGTIGLLISPFFFPSILYGLPRYPESIVKPVASGGNENDRIPEEKKVIQLNLEENYLQLIRQKTESAMREDQAYLVTDLNLQKFAERVQLPPHHLAWFFREIRKQPFNDYLNECRVNHAGQMILNGKAEALTVEAIGLMSGFTTRSTFFRAFKKTKGVTPGAFVDHFTNGSLTS
jgi:AraC-like DNA-binding protein